DESLLVRERDPQDARVVRLRVTGHARRRMAAWQNQGARVMHDALASLDPAERARVADALPVLRRLAEIIEGDR
ncbi:MAG: winged helix-turn-helix transcriptional regulator, partial [Actinobacteria bacterium]|nr:winged helix-turn-helix transcriptional regulator [Actinomycetota bacterium]